MDYRKRLMILQRASESTGRRWSVLERDEEPEMINIRDITQQKDDSDTEDYVSQVLMGALLENFLFKLLIIVMIVSNCIIMAFQTDAIIAKKYDIVFSICEHIILTVFIWEILVKWYYGFNIFWKSGWNVLDCLVTLALMLGPLIFPQGGDSLLKVIRVLRVCRSIRGFASMQGMAMMVTVIMQSIPDMANIFFLLLIIMLVFAVFGVTLFSAAVPSAFGDLFSALYTLFICITQDGWMDIYREFKADEGLIYGASLYFFIFLTGGAFIFANLLVAVVTTNLEISMPDYDEKNSNECSPAALIPEDMGGLADQSTIHVEEVVTKSNMTRRQKPWKASCLENLTMDTFEELALVMAAMQKNMAAYREIRQELDSIVEEVHSLSFNVKQEQEVMMRNHMAATLQDNLLNNDIATGRTGDILSTLITLEKAHVIDSNTASAHLFQKGNMRHAAMRLSMDSQMYYQSTSTHMDAGHSNTPSTHHNTG
ncbi:cation channel sperm-associated protein 4-like [Salvelinus namaycush]|uniref:Cation channel sperm-associated protein 4-like n=1 Tax=Salvelinus namaycush TaxID=8040 RepID=A0A8U0P9N8_SALNM|nr:cation channel sperm-associated protein 4-like [Salvelinus namaycush]